MESPSRCHRVFLGRRTLIGIDCKLLKPLVLLLQVMPPPQKSTSPKEGVGWIVRRYGRVTATVLCTFAVSISSQACAGSLSEILAEEGGDGDGDGDGDGWDKDRGPPRLGSTSGPGHVAVSPQHGAVVPSSFSSILEDVYPSDRYTVRSPSGVRSTPTSKPSGGVTNNASTLSVNSSRGVTAISGAPAGLPDRRSHVANSPESAAVPVSVIAGGKVLELERVQRYAGGAVALLYGGSLVSQSAWVSSCTVTSGVICRES